MPIKHSIGANKITESMLLPHLVQKLKGSRANNTVTTNEGTNIETIRLGADIAYGTYIAVGDDGKGYIASSDASDNKPAYAMCIQSGTTNDIVKIKRFGDVEISGASFIVNKTVWLLSGTPNFSTDLPDCTSGSVIQRLGKTLSATKIFIDIETERIVE